MGLKAFTLIKRIKFFFNPLFFESISFQVITLAVKKSVYPGRAVIIVGALTIA